MKHILDYLRKNFELSLHESRQLFWGLVVLLFLFVAYVAIDRLTALNVQSVELKEYMAPEASFQKFTKEREFETERPQNTGERQFVSFDPNTADRQTLIANHFPPYLADRLIKFRKSGMKFKRKEDLLKVYGIKPAFYDQLEGYIQLPAAEEDRQYATAERIFEDKAPAPKAIEKTPVIFDINLATEENLDDVRGIGKVFAQRIIKYRESLGGFMNVDQVKNTFGLPDSTFQELKKVIFVETPPRKFKINEVDFDHWPKGILKTNKRKAVLAYREQHGDFDSISDLRKVRLLDESDLGILEVYADFQRP